MYIFQKKKTYVKPWCPLNCCCFLQFMWRYCVCTKFDKIYYISNNRLMVISTWNPHCTVPHLFHIFKSPWQYRILSNLLLLTMLWENGKLEAPRGEGTWNKQYKIVKDSFSRLVISSSTYFYALENLGQNENKFGMLFYTYMVCTEVMKEWYI